ncbi:flagellar hook-basal body complex protein FliE [Curvivirga aplysinae]|uniref:flagellar hook-basal body complex protein FliE n=1 Tax=Curvivirga aplysinae TaxID=2529852 RepID=UPI0012BC4E57|nr:flagellar hook-basal body complex protein FliE [Curvivirga aplysinae]MTI11247.1 flagellar hook-basal body protein FliE [Curvivirga aplysinae]
MANISAAQAAAAYRTNALKTINDASAMKPSDLSGSNETGSDFLGMVKGAAETAIDANRHAEQVSKDAMTGKADLTDVVTAVASAEQTLQTVVTVRDKVISAYQEILKMPI